MRYNIIIFMILFLLLLLTILKPNLEKERTIIKQNMIDALNQANPNQTEQDLLIQEEVCNIFVNSKLRIKNYLFFSKLYLKEDNDFVYIGFGILQYNFYTSEFQNFLNSLKNLHWETKNTIHI